MKPSYNSARKIDHRQFLKSESEKRNFKNGISSNMKSKPNRKQDSSSIQGKHSSNGKLSKKNKRPPHANGKENTLRKQDLKNRQSSCSGKHFKKTKPVHQIKDDQKLKENKYEDKDME